MRKTNTRISEQDGCIKSLKDKLSKQQKANLAVEDKYSSLQDRYKNLVMHKAEVKHTSSKAQEPQGNCMQDATRGVGARRRMRAAQNGEFVKYLHLTKAAPATT